MTRMPFHFLLPRFPRQAWAVLASAFLSTVTACAGPDLAASIAGTWSLDLKRSDEVPAWKQMELNIAVDAGKVTLTRNLGWGRRRFSDTITVETDGHTASLPPAWWADNRHLGLYAAGDGKRRVNATVVDEGRTLRTEMHFTVESQQSTAPMRITSEYRLEPAGDRLTLIELRSSRSKPIVYHFTRKS